MTKFIKHVQMVFVLFLCVNLLNALLIANAYAQRNVDDLRKKGQQCIDWQNSQEHGDRLNLVGCLNSCARLAAMVDQKPDLLTEERIKQCNEAYAAVERQVTGEPEVPKDDVKQAPETIEEMVKDMNKVEQECKTQADNAKTPAEKRNAEACYNNCYRGALKISRGGVPVEQAKSNWRSCVGVKK